jgi:superfamily II DNA helicase RecQ
MYSSICKQAMEEVWHRSPNAFQSEIIPLILQMMAGDLPSEGLLLVQPTGSGKSSVPQTASVVTSGATIVIEPTLALSSDQASKFKAATNVPGGNVYSYQLDFQKNEQQRQELANNILTVLKQKATASIDSGIVSFVLFTSPETLLLPTWTNMVDELLEIKMLNLLCIDEVHLFIDFGLSFRRQFLCLRDRIFNKLIKSNINNNNQSTSTTLKLPVLCMTATFNTKLLLLLQQITNITFDICCFFWSPSNLFKK